MASTRSSSPPVVHCQRPQKSSRTTRRANFVSTVSSIDDSPALHSVSDVSGNDLGLAFDDDCFLSITNYSTSLLYCPILIYQSYILSITSVCCVMLTLKC
ncbi:hypothetical protein VIGAN_10175400 [Vigna angularis var. angularis]|uniref:Uncharacterized protein n=1 Tax=Vigna angularis var. angularis TaxID=157739 RepID=A0A0S3T4J7_PHAAN|nr:hypothetical protein VIGAN_10175400 [Vigna angularis var. angularis]